jgi:hypothetical protein
MTNPKKNTDATGELPATFAVSRRSSRTAPTSTVRTHDPDAYRCDVAAQAVLRGNQDIRVIAVAASASGNGRGHIVVRLGRVLVYLEDRDALAAGRDAWGRAGELADHAFGPLWCTEASEAAARIRRDGGTVTD